MKKIWKAVFFAAFLCLMAVPVHAKETEGSSATGAAIPKYEKVVYLRLRTRGTQKTMSQQLFDALEEARAKASSRVQYRITVPPGRYTQTHCFKIASNTYIDAKGAVWKKRGSSKCLFITEPNQTYENFVLDGGVWDSTGTDSNYTSYASMVRFAHVKNLVIQNATFKCRRGGHIIEVGDIKNMTVTNCTLTGNNLYRNLQPMEALQLDICVLESMSGLKPYNGKGCHNVIISNNNFHDVSRGVGSHADGKEADCYTNITVKNNQFKNVQGQGVYAMFWKKCTIQNNTIVSVHQSGIWCRSASKILVKNNAIQGVLRFNGERRKMYSGKRYGVLVMESNNCTVKNNTLRNLKGKVTAELGTSKHNIFKGNIKRKQS